MKYRLKMLKQWTDPNKKVWEIGSECELDNKAIAAEAVLDGFAMMVDPTVTDTTKTGPTGDINKTVTDAVGAALPDALDKALKAMAEKSGGRGVFVGRDRADDDPTFGYLPEQTSNEYSKSQKLFALGMLCQDVYQAGENLANPSPRLQKCIDRSRAVVEEGMKKGMIAKAAGSGLTVGANESLGALMPPIINTMLLDAAAETAIIRPRCSTFALSGAMELTFPKVKGYDRSGGLVHGGMVAYWRGENQLLKESKFELEDIRLNLSALTVLAFASHRVMRFAPVDVGAFLLPKMGDAITFKEEDAFLNGSGVGMPLGILKSPSKVTIAKEANQAAASIVTANVDKMISRIRIERAMSTVFLYNRADMYPLLVNLTRTIGTSGVLSMLYVPGANGTGTLSGFPAVNNDHCQALGTEGDLVLADWSQYLIADDRQGPETAQSMHLKFDYGQEAFRIIKYVDGQSVNSQAYTPHRGTNTTSGIITLAARG